MQTIARREFFGLMKTAGVMGISQALFPSWFPRVALRADKSAPPGDILVVVFQRGGMDGLNTVVPYGDGALYYDRRPTLSIPAPNGGDNAALDLNGHFGLHPALRPLKEIYDAGQLAVIHAAGSPDETRSHFAAMELMERGAQGVGGVGWLNRHLQTTAWQNESPFRAVGMGTLIQGSLQGPIPAFALQSIAEFHLKGRENQLATIQQTLANLYRIQAPEDDMDRQAAQVFATMDTMSQLAGQGYTPAHGAVYPETPFGMGLLQIAQLIKAEIGVEVACVDIGGWDTHELQGGAQGEMASVLADFAKGLGAFNTDLGEQMRDITVVTMSEFGRRVEQNASDGTDHGHANAMFVFGGGVNGGVHTVWPGLAEEQLDNGDLALTTDYRDVLGEIIKARLLNPALDQIFPNFTPTLRGIVRER